MTGVNHKRVTFIRKYSFLKDKRFSQLSAMSNFGNFYKGLTDKYIQANFYRRFQNFTYIITCYPLIHIISCEKELFLVPLLRPNLFEFEYQIFLLFSFYV